MHATRAGPTERYTVERRLGRGGMATVYLAEDRLLGRPVALKVLAPQFAADPALRQRFLREARLAASLSHPNIVAVYDVDEDEQGPFIVMEYVEGATLADELGRSGRFDPAEAVAVGLDLCAALEAAHSAGLVHRDITPRNVLRRPDGQVKLADFGIARSVAEPRLTELGTVLGTVAYLAPEQARGETVTRAADIYSLGVVLYELVTGHRPFAAATIPELVLERERGAVVPPSDLVPDIPRPLEGLLMRCLATEPGYRPRSAAVLAAELARAADEPVTAPLPAPIPPPVTAVAASAAEPRRRTPIAVARAHPALAAVVLALVVGAAAGAAATIALSIIEGRAGSHTPPRAAATRTPPRAAATHAPRTAARTHRVLRPTPAGELADERVAVNRAVAKGELDPVAAAGLDAELDSIGLALVAGAAEPAAGQAAALRNQLAALVENGQLSGSALAGLEAPLIRLATLLPPLPGPSPPSPGHPAPPPGHGKSDFGPPGHDGGHGNGNGNGGGNDNGYGNGNGNGND